MDDKLNARWLALLEAIRREVAARGNDPSGVHAHEELRVSLPLQGNEYFSHSFKESEVLEDDPAELASRLYAEYQAHQTRDDTIPHTATPLL